jgi:hypothetical protein
MGSRDHIGFAVWPRASVSDPDWIRIQSGEWIRIRIRIHEGKNDTQK